MSRSAPLGTRSVIESHLQDHLRRRVNVSSSSFIVNTSTADVEGADGDVLFQYAATNQSIRVPQGIAESRLSADLASVASAYAVGAPFEYTAPNDTTIRVRASVVVPDTVRRATLAVRRKSGGVWSDVAASSLFVRSGSALELIVEGLVPTNAGDVLGFVLRTRPEQDAGTVSITSASIRGELAP